MSLRPASGTIGLMLREGNVDAWVVFVLTFGAGLSQALTIALIGLGATEIAGEAIPWREAVVFVAMFKVMLILVGLAQLRGRQFAERVTNAAIFRIAERMPASELDRLERLGGRALVAEMTVRATALGSATHAAFGVVYCAGQIIGALGALCFFAPFVALLVTAAGGACFLLQHRMRLTADVWGGHADRLESRFTASAREFVDGYRELQAGRARFVDLVEHYLLPAARAAASARRPLARVSALSLGAASGSWSVMAFAAAFVAPALGFDTGITLAIFVTSLGFDAFLGIVTYVPVLRLGHDSVAWFERTGNELADGQGSLTPGAPQTRGFTRIELRKVVYAYAVSDAQPLGPIDLTLTAGEIVLVTGGNGSGKSTLMKLLAGLYVPMGGDVMVDRTIWHPDDYRSLFSAVFTDFHVFDIQPTELLADPERIAGLIEVWGLKGKVTLDANGFSSTQLSTGQRKRLALIQALLEDRPILLLDEWTADQDPEFRAWFFDSLLPELKARGRTVVAVTHDDRYFDRGDRVIRMADGQVVSSR